MLLAQGGGRWVFGARTPGGRGFPDSLVLGPLYFNSVLGGKLPSKVLSGWIQETNCPSGAFGGSPAGPPDHLTLPPAPGKWRKGHLAREVEAPASLPYRVMQRDSGVHAAAPQHKA